MKKIQGMEDMRECGSSLCVDSRSSDQYYRHVELMDEKDEWNESLHFACYLGAMAPLDEKEDRNVMSIDCAREVRPSQPG